MPLLNGADAIRIGGADADRVYLGSQLVWELASGLLFAEHMVGGAPWYFDYQLVNFTWPDLGNGFAYDLEVDDPTGVTRKYFAVRNTKVFPYRMTAPGVLGARVKEVALGADVLRVDTHTTADWVVYKTPANNDNVVTLTKMTDTNQPIGPPNDVISLGLSGAVPDGSTWVSYLVHAGATTKPVRGQRFVVHCIPGEFLFGIQGTGAITDATKMYGIDVAGLYYFNGTGSRVTLVSGQSFASSSWHRLVVDWGSNGLIQVWAYFVGPGVSHQQLVSEFSYQIPAGELSSHPANGRIGLRYPRSKNSMLSDRRFRELRIFT